MSKENQQPIFNIKTIDKGEKRKESKQEEIKKENFVSLFDSIKNKTSACQDKEKKKDEMDNDYSIEIRSSEENKMLSKNDMVENVNEQENDIPENVNYNLSKEPQNFSNESLFTFSKKDKKLSALFEKDKEAINTFHCQKSERLVRYIQKKRDIVMQRITEDFNLRSKRVKEKFNIMEKRAREDIKMDKDLKMIQLQDEVGRRAFEENLYFKLPDKCNSKKALSLKEESDGDDAEESIIGIKKEIQEIYFDLTEE